MEEDSNSLHEIRGRNVYCGPAAIAAVSGITTDEAARLYRFFTFQTQTRSVGQRGTIDVLNHLGFDVEIEVPESPTSLRAFVTGQDSKQLNCLKLISVPRHFLAIHKLMIADSENMVPVHFEKSADIEEDVDEIYWLSLARKPKPIPTPRELKLATERFIEPEWSSESAFERFHKYYQF